MKTATVAILASCLLGQALAAPAVHASRAAVKDGSNKIDVKLDGVTKDIKIDDLKDALSGLGVGKASKIAMAMDKRQLLGSPNVAKLLKQLPPKLVELLKELKGTNVKDLLNKAGEPTKVLTDAADKVGIDDSDLQKIVDGLAKGALGKDKRQLNGLLAGGKGAAGKVAGGVSPVIDKLAKALGVKPEQLQKQLKKALKKKLQGAKPSKRDEAAIISDILEALGLDSNGIGGSSSMKRGDDDDLGSKVDKITKLAGLDAKNLGDKTLSDITDKVGALTTGTGAPAVRINILDSLLQTLGLGGALDSVTDTLDSATGGLTGGLTDTVGGILDGATDAAGGLLDGTTDAVGNVAGQATDALDGATGGLTGGLTDTVGGVVDGATDAAGDVVDGATGAVGDIAGQAGDIAQGAAGTAAGAVGVKREVPIVGDLLKTLGLGKATGGVTKAAGDATGAAGKAAGDATGAAGKAAGDATGAVKDLLKGATKREVPIVSDLLKTLGLDKATGKATKAVGDAAGDATDAVGKTAGDATGAVGDIVKGAAGSKRSSAAPLDLDQLIDALGLGGVVDTVDGATGGAVDDLTGLVGDATGDATDAAKGATGAVTDTVDGLGKRQVDVAALLQALGPVIAQLQKGKGKAKGDGPLTPPAAPKIETMMKRQVSPPAAGDIAPAVLPEDVPTDSATIIFDDLNEVSSLLGDVEGTVPETDSLRQTIDAFLASLSNILPGPVDAGSAIPENTIDVM